MTLLCTPGRQELILPPREAHRQATRGEPQDRRGPVQDRRCVWLPLEVAVKYFEDAIKCLSLILETLKADVFSMQHLCVCGVRRIFYFKIYIF